MELRVADEGLEGDGDVDDGAVGGFGEVAVKGFGHKKALREVMLEEWKKDIIRGKSMGNVHIMKRIYQVIYTEKYHKVY